MLSLTGLALAVFFAWLYLVPTALDMYGAMQGPARWMMAGTWDARYFGLMLLMWALMMVGMMLPSAAPTILLYGAVARKNAEASVIVRIHAFTAGYLLAWTGFSLLATLLQWALSTGSLLSPMMVSSSPWLSSIILIGAGIYQWTPQKSVCLTRCRSPVEFMARYWRPGAMGAIRMGWIHGLFCLGCCWALMLLLFFGGVMSLSWIAAISIFVMLEKLVPLGAQGGKLSGLLLIAAGLTVASRAWIMPG